MDGEIPSMGTITVIYAAVLMATALVATLTHRAAQLARTIAENGGVDGLLSYDSVNRPGFRGGSTL